MIAKCGKIMIWHWAHESLDHCDPWRQGETAWHLGWKAKFPKEFAERQIIRDGKKHIADILLPNGKVIEFQHSPISSEEIAERESFYKNILWVFDATDAAENGRFQMYEKDGYWTFRWKAPRKTIRRCRLPIYIDIGDGQMFEIRKIYTATESYNPDRPRPWFGWGKLTYEDLFLKQHMPVP